VIKNNLIISVRYLGPGTGSAAAKVLRRKVAAVAQKAESGVEIFS